MSGTKGNRTPELLASSHRRHQDLPHTMASSGHPTSAQSANSQRQSVSRVSGDTRMLPENQGHQNRTSPFRSPWGYPTVSSSQQDTTQAHPRSDSRPHPPAMIGPTSTFYDPENNIQQTNSAQRPNYHQWIESYEPGPPMSFDQGVLDAQLFPAQGSVPSAGGVQPTMHPQYTFSTPPYTTSPPNSAISSSSLQTAVPYVSMAQGEYYYTPEVQHSFVPTSQPQQTPQNQSPGGSAYPDLLSIPNNRSRSGATTASSLSPSSWDESMHSGASSSTMGTVAPTPSMATPTTTSAAKSNQESIPHPVKRQSKSTAKSPESTAGNAAGKSRKRPRQTRAQELSDYETEDDYDGGASGAAGGGGTLLSRLKGACTYCRKVKMKCDFPENENTCKRCKAGGHVCVVERRKQRTAPNKREYLLAQIRQKDSIIESLIKQLHNPYIATPLGVDAYLMATSPSDRNNSNIVSWLDRMQSSVRPTGGQPDLKAFKLDARAGSNNGDDSDPESDHHAADDEGPLDEDDGLSQDPDNLQSLPDMAVPLGLIANLALSNAKSKNVGKETQKTENPDAEVDGDDVGVASDTYFMPGPATDLDKRASLIEKNSPPEILVHGLVTADDVEKLFEIFYERVNPFISLLDPALHTPASTFARCPFLFTVICAISSRYYADKSEIYPIAMHFAKHAAANALIDGWKSVELCQAYILMSVYAVPARKWEEDRSWMYTGLAIRIATDLNLHQVKSAKPQNEKQEREMLNKTRVWMICFNLDRSTATQFGKPSTIKEDYITSNSKDWYKKSLYNHPYDIHLCAYTSLLRIVARFHEVIFSDADSPTGLNKAVDFRAVTAEHDENLTRYHEEWSKRFARDSDPNDDGCAFRCKLLPFLVGYSRLVMYSFGFQQAFQRGIQPGDHVFFTKCLGAAKSVIRNMIEKLAPSGYMRYAPDGHFIFAAFASAFLLKLLRPEFVNLLSKEQEGEIFDLIGRLIQTLSSPEIAIDDRHTPRLYARFLSSLLTRHRRGGGTTIVGRIQPQPPADQLARGPAGDFPPQGSSMTTFSVQPQTGTFHHQGQQEGGYSRSLFGTPRNASTPVYRPEESFGAGAGMLDLGPSPDAGLFTFGSSPIFSEEEMLATMQALKNPAWWQNMMMPGFSWDMQSPKSNMYNDFPMSYGPNVMSNGLHGGFGGHRTTELQFASS